MRACLDGLPETLTLPATRKPLAEMPAPVKVKLWPAAMLVYEYVGVSVHVVTVDQVLPLLSTTPSNTLP